MAISLNSTTLAAALDATGHRVYLTSASTVEVGHLLFVDREAMLVQRLDGTVARVARGWGSTRAAAHASGATVYTGAQERFYGSAPTGYNADTPYTPWIDLTTGDIYTVQSNQWVQSGGDTVDLANNVTGTLAVAKGGTGLASYTIGDLVYASATTTLSKLADVATGNALLSGGVGAAPAWGKVALTTHVSGALPVANGGTGATTLVAAKLPIAGVAAYAKTTSGAQTTLAAASGARNLLIVVRVTEAFANGDGGQTTFAIGETDTTDKFAATSVFTNAALGTSFVLTGELSSTKALLVTGTAATGTGTGALSVNFFIMPAA